jgi:UDP-N-acetylmuramyl pentapeptide phosphotransferase/UDP-N-acetylglucosamine-1-phosphate transferase
MGDAGSMALGFIITWLLIDLSQGPNRAMTPVTALWIFAIPLMDTLRLMIFRMMNGHSPFKPGRDHLHYYFLDAGLSVQMTVKILLWSQVILSSIGIIGLFAGISEKIMFLAALSMFILFFIVLLDSEKAVLQLRRWLTA